MLLGNEVLEKAFIVSAIALLILLIRYHWRRRHMYMAASKINGPFNWPIVGNAHRLTGSTHDIVKRVSMELKLYKSPLKAWIGPKLGYGVSRPEQLEIILNSPHAIEKDAIYHFARPAVGNGLFSAPAAIWKMHRKIISPTFNPKILNSYVPIFHEQSKILVKNLEEYDRKGVFDVFSTINLCTLDIIWETALGGKINAQSGKSEYATWINDLLEVMFLRIIKPWLWPDFIFYSTKYGKIETECIENINKVAMPIIKEKRAEYRKEHENKSVTKESEEGIIPKRKIFLDYLIQVSEESGNLTNKDILDEVNTLQMAASDSSASTSSFALIMLGMHPEIQERVYAELEGIFQDENRPITTEDLSKMKYLEKVIKETMRLFPTAPFIARALTGDIELDGCTLPKGSTCLLALMNVQRDGEFWSEPLTFNPDRFDPEEFAKIHPYAYIPFSAGPRNCVGPKFAMMTMKVLLSEVVRNYKVYTDYKSVAEIEVEQDIVIKATDGFRVAFQKRSSN